MALSWSTANTRVKTLKNYGEFSQGYRRTTNNRMELLAVIVALGALKRPCPVDLWTDSK